ncbi:hypothetical protein [Plebeiibacterium sediminum]|uniref:Uncharacterized protein n=1 Tax=Plebeiibacterium sediminum TaxID=2992112 RepID=A0AAE3M0T4_9BACT|nr:hypothetical protein [Plebeiobacterium sediminum]MCW3784913.1 hypothetical protein [Plebeiobacterium sediminum]
MNIHRQIDANTILHYIEANNWHYNDKDEMVIDVFELSFAFYDCHYFVFLPKKYIEENFSFGMTMEGDSKLFESFEEAIEDEHWELIKKKCRQYEMWHSRFLNN